MTCTTNAFECHIKNHYIKSGDPNYHGEICGGCPWWHDAPEDAAFKAEVAREFPNTHAYKVKKWASKIS